MSSEPRSSAGPPLSAFGGLGLVLALSGPFYLLSLPASLLQRLDGFSSQAGALGPYLRQGTAYLRDHGPIAVTAWHAFEGIDVALAICAVIVGGLALLALTGRAKNVGNAMALCSVLAVGLVVYRMFSKPMPNDILSLGWGAYASLVCTAAMLVGGVLVARVDAQPIESEIWPLAVPEAPAAATTPLAATPAPEAQAPVAAASVAPPAG